MSFNPRRLKDLEQHLSDVDSICRDLLLAIRFQEMDIADLQEENEQLKATQESADEQRNDIFRHLADSLRELTFLRRAADKEEIKAKRRHRNPDWSILDKLNAQKTELEQYLLHIGPRMYGNNLQIHYSDDPELECYVLYWD